MALERATCYIVDLEANGARVGELPSCSFAAVRQSSGIDVDVRSVQLKLEAM